MNENIQKLHEEVIGYIRSNPIYLVYIDYRAEPSDEVAGTILRGDIDGAEQLVYDEYDEIRYDSALYEMDQIAYDVAEKFDINPSDVSDYLHDMDLIALRNEVMDELYTFDRSDTLGDLLRNARKTFIRVALGTTELRWIDDSMSTKEIIDTMGIGYLNDPRIPGIIEEIMNEVTEGWLRPFLFGSIKPIEFLDNEGKGITTFSGGSLLLQDTINGRGWDVELPEGITITVNSEDIFVDSDTTNGYAWDKVCGFVPGSYPIQIVPDGR